MKKNRFALAMVVGMVVLLFCCVAAADGLTLSEQSLTLGKGKAVKLEAEVSPADAGKPKLEWVSSDPAVATVKNGKVSGKSCGECDITCTVADGSGRQAVCHVTIVQLVQKLTVKGGKLTVGLFDSVPVQVKIAPEDATHQALTWESSDSDVAQVDGTGTITGIGGGDCVITARATDGSEKTLKLKVHVPAFKVVQTTATLESTDEYARFPLLCPGMDASAIKVKARGVSATNRNGYLEIYAWKAGKKEITLSYGKDKVRLSLMVNEGHPPESQSGDFLYAVNSDGTATITYYTGTAASLTIPESIDGYVVTRLGSKAFEKATFASVTIPSTVTSIAPAAFWACFELASVTLPDSVSSLGDHVFRSCHRLTEVSIPASTVAIGKNVFENCVRLRTITVAPDNPHYAMLGNALLDVKNKRIVSYAFGTIGTELTLPTGAEIIGEEAFGYNSVPADCETLVIPAGVRVIEDSAFAFTDAARIEMADTVERIGNDAFTYCENLTSIALSQSLQTLGDRVFSNCAALKEVPLPVSLTKIGNDAFAEARLAVCTVEAGSYAETYAQANGVKYVCQ